MTSLKFTRVLILWKYDIRVLTLSFFQIIIIFGEGGDMKEAPII